MKIIFVRGPNSFPFHPSMPKSNCISFLISGTELHQTKTELHQTKAALEVSENQARECESKNVELQDQIAKLTLELQKFKKKYWELFRSLIVKEHSITYHF